MSPTPLITICRFAASALSLPSPASQLPLPGIGTNHKQCTNNVSKPCLTQGRPIYNAGFVDCSFLLSSDSEIRDITSQTKSELARKDSPNNNSNQLTRWPQLRRGSQPRFKTGVVPKPGPCSLAHWADFSVMKAVGALLCRIPHIFCYPNVKKHPIILNILHVQSPKYFFSDQLVMYFII